MSVPATSTSRAVLAAAAVVAPVPPLAIDNVPVNELVGKAVQFERFPEEGVPNTGVTNVLLLSS